MGSADPASNTVHRAMASGARAPGVEGRIELYTMSLQQPGRSSTLLAPERRMTPSMPAEPKRRERQKGLRKSDCPVVPEKPGNAGGGKGAKPSRCSSAASSVHSDGKPVAQRLERITRRAREHRGEVFTNLAHHLDYEMLAESFRELKSGKAPGVDGVSKEEYGENIETNIVNLVKRLRHNAYHPQPSRRRDIPKGPGKTRPLGIPCFEDKLVQRGLVKVLNCVYEEIFFDFSYGSRPGRGCHDALKSLSRVIGTKKVNYVVEADIKGFFDHVDFDWLERMLRHHVKDPKVLVLVRRFLRAGVMKDGRRIATTMGTPQGGVISPLLANVYLHYVLDAWFAKAVVPQCRGEAYLVRYVDDFVACFQCREDAVRFYGALPQRLRKFKLEIAPEKTRMLEFGRFALQAAKCRGETKTAVFDFLGFTHYCGISRKGRFKLKWRTCKQRFRKSLRAAKEWLMTNRTMPLKELWVSVMQKLRGHYAYYGVSDNGRWLKRYRFTLLRLVWQWLNRRSQRGSFTWKRYWQYVESHQPVPWMRLVNLNSAFV
jgi:RNA-directed DNA polymerase